MKSNPELDEEQYWKSRNKAQEAAANASILPKIA
jgi:hypothetical protein